MKSIDSLYEEVAEYDLVIVPDPALASAIDRRLDRPHFGTFAITPRRLAAGRRERAEDRIAFLEVIDEADDDWRSVAHAIGNVLECWEQQGQLRSILDYDAYVDETTRTVVETMGDIETTSSRLTDHRIDSDRTVAVVGYEQLTPLERSVLPEAFDSIDPFTEESFEYPQFHVFESTADIVSALTRTISPEDAENVAVVLDGSSQYSSLVESTFEAADIPFFGGPGFIHDAHHRGYLRLIRIALGGEETTVADAEAILTHMGIEIDVEHRVKRIDRLDIHDLDWLVELSDSINEHTFGDVVAIYEAAASVELADLKDELASLGILDALISTERLDALEFYLQTYEVPVDREDEGVLLVDANSSSYVDRATVFYLGMDDGWRHAAPNRPWVDRDARFDRYIDGFQLLLQSGDRQYYLVRDAEGGEAITPSPYLNELIDEDFERFSDLDSTPYATIDRPEKSSFERTPLDIDFRQLETVSQSSLNTYVNSPRDYFFSRLLDAPDRPWLAEGTLFHDFAELYVDSPEVIEEVGLDAVVDLIETKTSSFYRPYERPLRRRKYRIGLETIAAYLDEHSPEPDTFVPTTTGWGSNDIADHFDVSIDSPLTEHRFEESNLGIHGIIDLIRSPSQIVDYKTGRKNERKSIVSSGSIDPVDDSPNFQAIMYLTYFRRLQPAEQLSITFMHFLETMDDVIEGSGDIEDTLTTVDYYPISFQSFVNSAEAYELLLDGYTDCRETFEDLGLDNYLDVTDRLTFPETDEKSALRASEFAEMFTTFVDRHTVDAVDAEKGSDQAIRELNKFRARTFFREDLDAFEEFVTERIDELNRRLRGEERFPIEGLGEEPNYRRMDHRDLLVAGNRDE